MKTLSLQKFATFTALTILASAQTSVWAQSTHKKTAPATTQKSLPTPLIPTPLVVTPTTPPAPAVTVTTTAQGSDNTTVTTTVKSATEHNPLDGDLVKFSDAPNVLGITVDESELKNIAETLGGIQNVQPITLDPNDLYDKERDAEALNAARKVINETFLKAAAHVGALYTIIYQLEAAHKRDYNHLFTESLNQAYQTAFQNQFTQLVSLFIGANQLGYTSKLIAASRKCYSMACLMDLSYAEQDFIQFGNSINSRLDIANQTAWVTTTYTFQSRMIKNVMKSALEKEVEPNQEDKSVVKLLRRGLAPFVAASSGVNEAGRRIFDFLENRKMAMKIELYAEPIIRTVAEEETINKNLKSITDRIIKKIAQRTDGNSTDTSSNTDEDNETGQLLDETSLFGSYQMHLSNDDGRTWDKPLIIQKTSGSSIKGTAFGQRLDGSYKNKSGIIEIVFTVGGYTYHGKLSYEQDQIVLNGTGENSTWKAIKQAN